MADEIERFYAKFRTPLNGCWEWNAYTDRVGYGRFKFKSRMVPAHRFMYELIYGKITTGLFVCHHCNNPSCVRPTHLFRGTHDDNMKDMVDKGRSGKGRRKSSKLTSQIVCDIREIFKIVGNRWGLQTQLAKHYGVSLSCINMIKSGCNWRNV